jgi:hypothetical protein
VDDGPGNFDGDAQGRTRSEGARQLHVSGSDQSLVVTAPDHDAAALNVSPTRGTREANARPTPIADILHRGCDDKSREWCVRMLERRSTADRIGASLKLHRTAAPAED